MPRCERLAVQMMTAERARALAAEWHRWPSKNGEARDSQDQRGGCLTNHPVGQEPTSCRTTGTSPAGDAGLADGLSLSAAAEACPTIRPAVSPPCCRLRIHPAAGGVVHQQELAEYRYPAVGVLDACRSGGH